MTMERLKLMLHMTIDLAISVKTCVSYPGLSTSAAVRTKLTTMYKTGISIAKYRIY